MSGRVAVPLVVLLLTLVGCASTGPEPPSNAQFGPVAPHVVADPPAPATPPPAPRTGTPVPRTEAIARSAPVGLFVPAIGVRTGPLLTLGIDRDGTLEVPPDATAAGWFGLSPTPGALGPAVIVAHVDYDGIRGIFFRLKDLHAGDEAAVRLADGTEAVFTTYRVDRYPKTAFPSATVYGNTAGPELRLITCGGVFDHGTGQYQDNIVAYARLTGTR